MTSKVHRVRFYNPKPLAVNSLSLNEVENWLAISREDASIEIWDIKYNPFLLKSIPGYDKGSVEALCWVNRRLISTGMGGALVEWDLETLTSKWSAMLTGYAAWCLDVDAARSVVAVGTEQGYVNLFQVEPDQFVYDKVFDKQEGRIICCKFDKTGQLLVTGSVGTIRIWDVSSGLAVHRLQANRRGKETLVWSVAVLSDMTIVSGDSNGRLTFWDGNLAEQIESFATHKADILSVVVSSDEKFLYCSGVDPTVVCFTRVGVASKRDQADSLQWVKSVQRQVHEHDVRVLALKGNMLMSLGADGYLALSRYPPKWLMRLPPLPPAPRVAVASAANKHLLLLRYTNHIEVWKLGRYSTSNKGEPIFLGRDQAKQTQKPKQKPAGIEEDTRSKGIILKHLEKQSSALQLQESPVKLVSVRAKGNRQIKCCAISPNGQFLMYSTDEVLRIFTIELGGGDAEDVSLVRTSVVAGEVGSCARAVFTQDSRALVVHARGALAVLHADTAGFSLHSHIQIKPHLKDGSIIHLETGTVESSATTYVACADAGGGVAVWSRAGAAGKFKHHSTLPTFKSVASALAIDNVGENLLVVCANNKIAEYELRQCRFSEWPRRLPTEWHTRSCAVTGASYHPRGAGALTLHDHTAVWTLQTHTPAHTTTNTESSEPAAKKQPAHKQQLKYKIVPCKYLAGMAWLGPDEAVQVQVLPENIIKQLPPVLATKKFPDV